MTNINKDMRFAAGSVLLIAAGIIFSVDRMFAESIKATYISIPADFSNQFTPYGNICTYVLFALGILLMISNYQ